MKQNKFSLVELLVVIAVIAILAALILAVTMYARGKSRAAECISNQGQTIKMLIAGMEKNDSKLISGASGDDLWTTALHKKGILRDLPAVRCPEIAYDSEDITNENNRKEAFGVAVATDGKFNFKSNKISKSGGVKISPASMMLGGCATDSNKKAAAALDFSNSKLEALHQDAVNVFFLDGSVSSVDADDFDSKSYFRPKADGSGSEKVSGALR